jgi:hypothetical protein
VSADLRLPGVWVGQIQVQPLRTPRCESRDGDRAPKQTVFHYVDILLVQ